jgi:transcriptional regulator with XRE-family HTH domain
MAKACKDLRNKVRSNPERAARVKTRRQAIEDALALAEIRERRELTQTDIAQVLEMSQANVSRIERQQNLYLSTLAEYVEALGSELKLSAVFAERRSRDRRGPRALRSALTLRRAQPHRALDAIPIA